MSDGEHEQLLQLAGACEVAAAAAFTALYRRLHPPVQRYLLSLGRRAGVPRAVCEEIAQDVWGVVWERRLDGVTPPLQAYLCTSVRNRLFNTVDRLRVEERRAREFYISYEYPLGYDRTAGLVYSAPPADLPLLRAELHAVVVRTLRRMRPGRRRVVLDHLCHERSIAETVERLGVAVSTVKALRGSGGKQLRAVLVRAGYERWE